MTGLRQDGDHRSWIRKTTRRFINGDGYFVRRGVWRAQAKIGTQPGTVALFLAEPVVGAACELVEDGRDYRVARPVRVTIDRFDDVSQRVFCSLR